MTIYITGAGGLLGQALMQSFVSEAVTPLPWRLLLDDAKDVDARFKAASPTFVLNCAAHTDVEEAERNPEADRIGNVELPARLAKLCAQHNATLVHISSTGCYGKGKTGAYIETDEVVPTTVHHRHKLAGEQAILASGCRSMIFRTGWLYGGQPGAPKNFVWKRLLEARKTNQMQSDASQRGVPTSNHELARQIRHVMDANVAGVFNATAHGSASRYDYVSTIVKASGLPCEVTPGPAFKRLADVSSNETALNQALSDLGLDVMATWNVSLQAYVHSLMASPEWAALA